MIWVLVVLSLNLPMGKISNDDISGLVYATQDECMLGLRMIHEIARDEKTVLNAACIRADNTKHEPQPSMSRGVRRPT